ncbi:hypothetical protein BOX15_Mlig016624g2 [Macrostomum lignano]|uniref:Protein kinase domain-containing protein n=1 Tax=Macrostomum lignano TaxID=282301 RepID=A0A267GGL8_9PLAT|nr:hypothetical protein BOX15_Mlig016624g2 [Macrostomum lignano]
MEMHEVLTRTNSMILGSEVSRSTLLTRSTTADISAVDWIAQLNAKCKTILSAMCSHSDLLLKYDLTSREPDSPMIYVNTRMPSKFMFNMEAFPRLSKLEKLNGKQLQVEELVYHKMFEAVIERYTNSNQKPNPVLRDTRSSEFCYRMAIKVEAVPAQKALKARRLILLREFLILQHLWECFHREMKAKVCGTDQLIGFPMPFEFKNVVGCSEFDFTEDGMTYMHYNIHGAEEKVLITTIPQTVPDSTSTTIGSSLSYMATERLGPSLGYLIDLMRSQGKTFSVSSALKIYDQILCRMMIMHKYGVVHCDPNPSCFYFGPGESCNVLYISELGSALVKPEFNMQVPRFHDRFVSYLRFRERRCHFVQDVESAFYIFLYMLVGRLPWDGRTLGNLKPAEGMSMVQPSDDPYTDRSLTIDDKEKFWQNQDTISRAIRVVEMEIYDPLYVSFTADLLEALYSRTRESLQLSSSVGIANYMKDCCVGNTQAYNVYYNLRRVIATYFRFEILNQPLKDRQGSARLEQLNRSSTNDLRIAFDLSHWCWNHLDPNPNSSTSKRISFKT